MAIPLSTPITKFPGLSQSDVAKLTPAAAKLAKSDLIELAVDRYPGTLLDLKLSDLKSIHSAFEGLERKASRSPTADEACCCCTPCCCTASAVVQPIKA